MKNYSNVYILGAFDRFNYGDLLFPIIIEEVFKKMGCAGTFHFLGLVQSDLRCFGGKRTEAIGKLFKNNYVPDNSILIIAGGDILGAQWCEIFSYVLHKFVARMLPGLRSVLGDYCLKRLIQKFHGVSHDFPFILGHNDFKLNIKVAYNAVGGSGFRLLADCEKRIIGKTVSNSCYVSVRDKKIFSWLQEECDCLKHIALVPDSAVLVSNLFPVSELANKVSKNVIQIIHNNPEGYIVFQMSEDYGAKRTELITHKLRRIQANLGHRIVLLPIGRATGHCDQIILKRLYQQLKTTAYFIPKPSIYDIMYLIANAMLFVGSSLHGNITAISYAVPHIGLKGVPKLEAFLHTWDYKEQEICVDPADLDQNVESRLHISRTELRRRAKELAQLSYEHFQNMFYELGLLDSRSNK